MDSMRATFLMLSAASTRCMTAFCTLRTVSAADAPGGGMGAIMDNRRRTSCTLESAIVLISVGDGSIGATFGAAPMRRHGHKMS